MDPLAAYTFRVWLGEDEYGFSKVSGLSRESEAVVYQEGGLNNRVHVLPGVVKNPRGPPPGAGALTRAKSSPSIWRGSG